MIQRTPPGLEARIPNPAAADPAWQTLISGAIRDPEELLRRLGLPAGLAGAREGHRRFPVFVPEPYLQRIEPGTAGRPTTTPGTAPGRGSRAAARLCARTPWPRAATASQGLIRKYRSRALMIFTGACAINCRYCFRRHFPYSENRIQRQCPGNRAGLPRH